MDHRLTESDVQRFLGKLIRGDGCWGWTGAHFQQSGYALFNVRRLDGRWVPTTAHRISHQVFKGPIDEGLTIDHLCRNPPCVNPEHLEAVTQRVNILRSDSPSARQARQTHCLNGHPFDEANTYRKPSGKRECILCMQQRERLRHCPVDKKAFFAAGHVCKAGHPLNERYASWLPRGGWPQCRECNRLRAMKRRKT